MSTPGETIVAIATAPGRGGIGIVRISGPRTVPIAVALTGAQPTPRRADVRPFLDAAGEPIDRGIVLYFAAPRSYTGEDVLELHGHGGPVVLDALVARAVELGARPARPGEFTERAYLNDRLDLAQAEAVADLIDAGTEAAARAARRSLDGALSREVEQLADEVADLRAWVEAAIDFPDDEVDHLADERLAQRLRALKESLGSLRARVRQGVLLREGVSVVIAGQPNVGKSSLLNVLCARDAAIVTDVPGTTRDLVRERFAIAGVTVELVDTAGLRESADDVERLGIERAWTAMDQADALLLVCEDRPGPGAWEHRVLERIAAHLPVLLVRNKIDLHTGEQHPGAWEGLPSVGVSARDGTGLGTLVEMLGRALGQLPNGAGEFSARRRHLVALDAAAAALTSASERVGRRQGDLAAEDLREAHRSLGDIVGADGVEDLLARIFSSFCIGK